MPYVKPEMIEKARTLDLLTYLQRYEPDELVHLSGNTYCTKTHDSLKISNGKWRWWSTEYGGNSALDYLIIVKGIEFTSAVLMLCDKHFSIDTQQFKDVKKENQGKLILPPRNQNNDCVIKYLTGRGIDVDIINYCIEKGILYESKDHHNAIFLGLNSDNEPKYAMYRATNNVRFLGDATGSDKSYSFRLLTKNSNSIHLFESAIDLLSYATLLKLYDRDWQNYNLLSLSGVYQPQKDISKSKVPKALSNFLDENPLLKRVVFHLDNDKAGQNATKAISLALPDCYEKINKPSPTGKDFNDYLCMQLGIKINKLNERNDFNER